MNVVAATLFTRIYMHMHLCADSISGIFEMAFNVLQNSVLIIFILCCGLICVEIHRKRN